jgi:carbon storage regulator
MLVMSRKPNETIVIADGRVVITILETRQGNVKLGIDAPDDISIHRGEIQERVDNARKLGTSITD